MQSGYESAEIYQQQKKQFMAGDEYCCSSGFSVVSNPNKQNQPHHHQQQLLQQFHPVATTQQLFEHQQHPQFEAFHQQQQQQQQQQQRRLHHQLGLEREPGRGNVGNGGAAAPLSFFNVNFKLGLNENSGNREGVLNKEEEALLRGSEGRPNSLVMSHCWQSQEHSTIKEPFWKPLNTELFNRNNKRCNEDGEEEELEENRNKYCKSSEKVNGNVGGNSLENKYRLFGELEAIYSTAGMGEANQTGSGSALTTKNSPTDAGLRTTFSDLHRLNVATAGAAAAAIGVDHVSETSIEEDASLRKIPKKKKRRRKMKDQLGSMAGFFASLVKQLMDHQEGRHKKFLEAVENLDRERVEREEAWRRQEAAKFKLEAIARAHEQALASSREATIVSYLEKITGQNINLPIRKTQLHLQSEIDPMEPINELIHQPIKMNNNVDNTYTNTNNRWPKAAVEALIRVRSSLESKFQEPGLKGSLWEEISSSMASMGYEWSAKRCKEKWENINKYFKKTKDIVRKRPQQSKTCPYFDQLGQLYSRSSFINSSSSSSQYCYKPSVPSDVGVQTKSNSELLDAIIVGSDQLVTTQNLFSENFEVAEMVSLKLDFDGFADEKLELIHQGRHGKEKENHGHEDDKDEDVEDNAEEEEDEEEEEEEGEEGDFDEEEDD